MKVIIIFGLGLFIGFAACQSSVKKDKAVDSGAVDETGTLKKIDSGLMIIPGHSIGKIFLAENMADVGVRLGKPDAGDAAMGKAWSIWYQHESSNGIKNELVVYSSYRDTSMRVKDVKQMRVTSPEYKTQDNIGTGNTESEVRSKFPSIEKISAYLNERKDTITIYDSRKAGIGFEFLKGRSVALIIHPIGQVANNTYQTLHPEWKPID